MLIIQPTCGDNNGSVTIDVQGGSGNYTYSWGGTATQSDLTAGTYDVVVTDTDSGCEQTVSFVLVDDVASATITASDVFVSCPGDSDLSLIHI